MRRDPSSPPLLATLLLLALLAPPLAAAEPVPSPTPAAGAHRTYRIARTRVPIQVDGHLDEEPWQGPPTFTLDYEVRPADNTRPAVATEMWITYDDRNLYIAARAHDPHPRQIRAHLRDRDNATSDDFVGVVLDTFNDERRASEFFVNPLGVQMDLSQNDVTGNEDPSWDALWASAGRLTESGYEVEMAIPFSSLRFPPSGAGEEIWGIDGIRYWPRDQARLIALNPRPRGRNCYLCGEAKLSGLAGITPGRNVEADPTVTSHRSESRADSRVPFASESKVDPGVTGRWGITPGMTLNATLNPDFSQVEADAAQLSVNNQFALFFPEKRPFFLEGADLFDTKLQSIYTRTIADPSWGIKVTGKEGKNAIGAIVAHDTLTNLLFPGSQNTQLGTLAEDNVSSILRYRRDLAGAGSSLGALVTDRESSGYHNRVLGADGLYRWGDEAMRLEVLGSDTIYPLATASTFDQPTGTMRGYAGRFAFQHTTRDWMGLFQYNEVSKDFRADLGFIPQSDFRKGYGDVERYYYSDEGKTWWTRFTLAMETTWTYDHAGNPLQRQVSPYFSFNGPRQWYANVYIGTGNSFYGGRSFDRNFVDAYTEVQAWPSVFLTNEVRVGQEIDVANARGGRILRDTPSVRWEPGAHLRLNLAQSYEQLDIRDARLYTANITDLRITYQLSVRTFVRVVTQYFDIDRVPALYTFPVDAHSRNVFDQLLFSYKLNPQTVLFLGYSDTYAGLPAQANAIEQTGRTFFFKVGYALVM